MITISWRTGVNMREFAYYDRREFLPFPNGVPPTREFQIAALQRLGVPLVRFFAAQHKADVNTNIAQVGLALNALQKANMQAIVVLGDSISVSGFSIPGDDDYHQGTPLGHINKRYWHEPGYTKNYFPYVQKLVSQYANHPAVLAWELGNEFAMQPQPSSDEDYNSFIQFAKVVSADIKQRSPHKLISTGLINTNQLAPGGDSAARHVYAQRLYSLPNIDMISLHVYAEDKEDDLAMIDVEVAKSLNKPFFVGELGIDVSTGNRAQYIQSQLQLWKSRGAFSAMLWAFDDSPQDTGVADTKGFARRFGDYGGIAQIVSGFTAPALPVVNTADVVLITNGPTDATTTTTTTITTTTNTTISTLPFSLSYPMNWTFDVQSKFNDPANYSGQPSKVQKREGMLFIPNPSNQSLEVRAAQRGRVTRIDQFQQGYGNFLCITHDWFGDSFVTWYGQLASINVKIGQNVNQGDVIGIAGQSGSATEVCLFLTLQHTGKGLKNYVVDDVVDPLTYLASTAVAARNEAAFVADATIPDNQIIVIGAPFKKIWNIRNNGTTAWGAGYELAFFADEPLGVTRSVPLPAAQPGEIKSVAVDMIAPTTPGIHRSTWKPRAPDGTFFPFEQYVLIDVRATKTDTANPVLRFAADVTVLDGTVMAPGQKFTKTWRVLNDGNKVWDATYLLAFDSDDNMQGGASVPLPPLRPGQTGEVSVNLTAPNNVLGIVRSTWKPRDPQGNPFEFELYAEINVQTPGALNTASLFPSPIAGHWTRGFHQDSPVNYGDGKHNGD
ncbi:MAG: NBR1-Ig-like domain-containing protein, partial [Chloroflexota bacterium]